MSDNKIVAHKGTVTKTFNRHQWNLLGATHDGWTEVAAGTAKAEKKPFVPKELQTNQPGAKRVAKKKVVPASPENEKLNAEINGPAAAGTAKAAPKKKATKAAKKAPVKK